jgi:hypothetical protein
VLDRTKVQPYDKQAIGASIGGVKSPGNFFENVSKSVLVS